MRDASVPENSLVLIELDPSLYNVTARDQIAEHIRTKFKAQAVIVGAHDHYTTINVLTPGQVQDASRR